MCFILIFTLLDRPSSNVRIWFFVPCRLLSPFFGEIGTVVNSTGELVEPRDAGRNQDLRLELQPQDGAAVLQRLPPGEPFGTNAWCSLGVIFFVQLNTSASRTLFIHTSPCFYLSKGG